MIPHKSTKIALIFVCLEASGDVEMCLQSFFNFIYIYITKFIS